MRIIFYRRTFVNEGWNEGDKFIAWVQGEAAGSTAPTANEAIKKVEEAHPNEMFQAVYDYQSR